MGAGCRPGAFDVVSSLLPHRAESRLCPGVLLRLSAIVAGFVNPLYPLLDI